MRARVVFNAFVHSKHGIAAEDTQSLGLKNKCVLLSVINMLLGVYKMDPVRKTQAVKLMKLQGERILTPSEQHEVQFHRNAYRAGPVIIYGDGPFGII